MTLCPIFHGSVSLYSIFNTVECVSIILEIVNVSDTEFDLVLLVGHYNLHVYFMIHRFCLCLMHVGSV